MIDPRELMPGDCLLYAPSGVFGRAIAWMTSGGVSHVEVYKGVGVSYASRDGLGTNEYPLRTENLCRVLRSRTALNMGRMGVAFEAMRGQPYDWKGILNTALGGAGDSSPKGNVCSAAATIWYRVAGLVRLFGAEEPEHITPRDFEKSDYFWQVWSE
tara:strand:+ start:182 stop:652 length:471 start_codon:yes stop_codon:yes gene_type:complete